MQSLQGTAPRTLRELSERTSLHPSTVMAHLNTLIDQGYVVHALEHRPTRGRPRWLFREADGSEAAFSERAAYRATAAGARGDLLRRLRPSIAIGWSALPRNALHQVDALVIDLYDAALAPRARASDLSVAVSPCPLLMGHVADRVVICGVHVRMMASVLRHAGGPVTIAEHRELATPLGCTVHLRVNEPAAYLPSDRGGG